MSRVGFEPTIALDRAATGTGVYLSIYLIYIPIQFT